MRAIIIGAGIAGLATALRLHQIGWDTLIVERAPARRGGGYAVTFGGIGYDAAERMGILPDLRAKSFETTELVYHKGDGSRRFALDRATIAATTGARSITILRGDLEAVLYDAVRDHATIRFGTTLTAVAQDEQAVRVTLSDGTIETADLLIGADGLHSATRALLFGPEEDFLLDLDHRVAVFMLEQRPAAIAPGATGTLSSRGRTAAVISVGDDRNVAFFGYRADHALPDEDVTTQLERIYGDLGWVIPEALAGLERADSVYFDTISQVVAPSWSSGRVVLLGDAAWCVTLFAGYGSSLAVGGADRLGTELAAHPGDIPGALHAWEAVVRPEAERKQRLGRRVKGVYAPANPLLLWLSLLPLRLATLPPVRRYMTRRFIKG
ncbi:FAD-dependent monooxygenase [Promicromonospora iranensis]|uniref:2-polyprenyl-6-methoxyphenol hydroxylase-like FAD-dependent oxidoreductase n=1 Tax=Promicromonospora iranensis TaxID=1105144 RepID=A0ABU2CID8_9MICO|nr:FAD-dependent monooxygenase [Promicromonospora iranensis]MDR7381099.1 2-polyprenyl-6-methoxyphenol hydroxylase-like FAD-dependent oxidoreductase [Promicromonospora iranensis]